MKIKCIRCGDDKEEKDFYHHRERVGLKSKLCKKCSGEVAKEKRQEKKAGVIYAF